MKTMRASYARVFRPSKMLPGHEAGFTLFEFVVVAAIISIALGAIYTIIPSMLRASKEVERRFVAENRSRTTGLYLEKILREGERLGAPGYSLILGDAEGYYLDVRHDGNIVRFWLDTTNKQVKEFVDSPDGSGDYNYQTAGGGNYSYYSTDPPDDGQWDETKVIGEMVANVPAGTAQGAATNPETDQRLFTFYSNDFDTPIDASAAGWMSLVKGVTFYVKVDADEDDAYEAAGLRTNVSIRNLGIE